MHGQRGQRGRAESYVVRFPPGEAGRQASVTKFLEAQPDCFYRIQKTPEGMSFVTARGWDDLARMITLNERLGIAVDPRAVQPDEGYKRDCKVPCAPSAEDVRFEALVLRARKR